MSDNRYKRRSSLVGPIILIGLGAALLLENLGIITGNIWLMLVKLWPLLLVLIGIDILFGRRSTLGSVVSGVLVLGIVGGIVYALVYMQEHPFVVDLLDGTGPRQFEISAPLDAIERAEVEIDWNANDGSLTVLDDSEELIAGHVVYYSNLIFDVDATGDEAKVRLDDNHNGTVFFFDAFSPEDDGDWELGLNPEVEYSLILDTNAGQYNFDLAELSLSYLELDASSGAVSVELPYGGYRVDVDASSGALNIVLPEKVGVRLELDRSSGGVALDGAFELVSGDVNGDGIWETAGFEDASAKINIVLDGSSGGIRIFYAE